MEKEKLSLAPPSALTVPTEAVEALVGAGDGDAALLYLHILLRGGTLDADRAATELHRSDREIGTTARRLRGMGLLAPAAGQARAPLPSRELSQPETADVVRRSMEDDAFRALVDSVQATLGRILSSTDLKRLFGIYDELAMPTDVIYLLIQYCREETERRYGPSRNVSFAYIEKQAYDWFDRELMTYDLADRWLRRQEERRTVLGRLQSQLHLGGRPLTQTEQQYLGSWLDLGYSEEAICMAAERTRTNTGGLKWKYADSIVRSWHEKGLHTPEEIEAGDRKESRSARSGARRVSAAAAPTSEDDRTLEQLARLRERMKTADKGGA